MVPYPTMWEINDSPQKSAHLVIESFELFKSCNMLRSMEMQNPSLCVYMSFCMEIPIGVSIHWIVTLSTLTYSMDIGGRWCWMLITYHDKYLTPHQHFVCLVHLHRSTFCSIDWSYGKCEWNLLKIMNNVFLYLHVLKLILGYYCVQI